MKIILASKSPQRKKILHQINLKFKVCEPKPEKENQGVIFANSLYKSGEIDESLYCKFLAFHKANEISNNNPNSLVISADTIILFNKKILGKPKNKSEAVKYLKLLSNNIHYVLTGVCLLHKNKKIKKMFYDKTIVYFNKLNDSDIKFYVKYFNPTQRAGAYGIQEWSSIFVKKINGCYYNVVGFPLPKFYKLFKKIN